MFLLSILKVLLYVAWCGNYDVFIVVGDVVYSECKFNLRLRSNHFADIFCLCDKLASISKDQDLYFWSPRINSHDSRYDEGSRLA